MSKQVSSEPNTSADPSQWRQHLEQAYSLRELKVLCRWLNVDPENLRHETKPELALDLVDYLQRRGRLADLVREEEGYRTSGQDTLAAYREQILQETELVSLKGIPLPRGRDGRILEFHVPLDKVYIQLQAIEQKALEQEVVAEEAGLEAAAKQQAQNGQEKSRREQPDFLTGLRTLGEYLYRQGQVYRAIERPQPVDPQAAVRQHDRLVILGPPGAGKSTLLRFLTRRVAEDPRQPVPVLVPLRDYATALETNPALSLREFSLDQAAGGNDTLRLALETVVEREQALWLLDALDETRLRAGDIAQQAIRLPGPLVLTSRPMGYASGPLHALPHFEVLPLVPEKVEQFLHDWFGVLAGGEAEPGNVEQQVETLRQQLQDRPQLQRLTRNPLLLTFLVVLAQQRDRLTLPQQRAKLYARYIIELRDWEFQRRAQTRGQTDDAPQLGPLIGEDARKVAGDGLCYLGWALQLHYYGGQGQAAPTREALQGQLATYLQQEGYAGSKALAAEALAFWQTAGMLDEWRIAGHTYLAFRHFTFQEYATAWGLRQAWQRDRWRCWGFLRPRLHYPAWREPILLASSLLPKPARNELVRQLYHGVSRDERSLYRDSRLAGDILRENPAVDARLVAQVNQRLAWLGRSHKRQQRLLLLVSYIAGLPVLFIFLPRLMALLITIVWSGTWLGSFASPLLRGPLGLPSRLRRWTITPFRFISPLLPHLRGPLGLPPRLRRWTITPFRFISPLPLRLQGILEQPLLRTLFRFISALLLRLQDILGLPLRLRGLAITPFLAIWESITVTKQVLQGLQDGDWDVRREAAEALGQLGDVTAVSTFLRALQDEDESVRRKAAESLGQLGDVAAVPALVQALQDGDRDVRRAAAESLGQLGDVAAVPMLLQTLRDKSGGVRRAAAELQGQLGDVVAMLALLQALRDESEGVCHAAAALGQLGDVTAMPVLLQALQDGDRNVRRVAAQALGQLGDVAAVPALLQALRDRDWFVRQAAAQALGKLEDVAAIPALRQALQDEDGKVRWVAVEALGKLGDVAAIPALLQALQDENWIVRRAAVEALGKLGDVAAIPALRQALQDEHEFVRRIGGEVMRQLSSVAAVPVFLQVLQDGDKDMRQEAVEALGQLRDVAAMPALLQALQDEDEYVRRAAVEALGKLGDGAAIPALRQVLQDGDWDVRRAAAESLGQLGDVAAVPALLQALQDEDEDVRQTAVEVLGKLGDVAAIPALRQVLQDGDEYVRRAAVEALGKLGDVAAIPALQQALRDREWFVRRTAAESLGKMVPAIHDLAKLRQIRNALWWRVTDLSIGRVGHVGPAAQAALEQVVNRITELEVLQLKHNDPLGPAAPPHAALKYLRYGSWLVATAVTVILVETAANLLSAQLGAKLPLGAAGAIAVVVALLAFLVIGRRLEG